MAALQACLDAPGPGSQRSYASRERYWPAQKTGRRNMAEIGRAGRAGSPARGPRVEHYEQLSANGL